MNAGAPALTRAQAAAILGIHPDTLDDWAASGRIGFYDYGTQRRYDRDEVIGMKEARYVPRTPSSAPAPSRAGEYQIKIPPTRTRRVKP